MERTDPPEGLRGEGLRARLAGLRARQGGDRDDEFAGSAPRMPELLVDVAERTVADDPDEPEQPTPWTPPSGSAEGTGAHRARADLRSAGAAPWYATSLGEHRARQILRERPVTATVRECSRLGAYASREE
ncbi:hypothetical protein ACFVGY_14610 [Streptomyces sp. NPDC127106]|uniref:hypothetical protein n=1 Tax=Streptomyces sp. NPDC127106 TaxID=3345360 RepID=UPI003639AAFD